MSDHPPGWVSPDVMAEIKLQFFQECEEYLTALETGILAIEAGDTDPETVNTILRAAHSMKGGAATFGLDVLVKLSHRLESVLSEVRSKQVPPKPQSLKVLLQTIDSLADLVHAARDGGAVDEHQIDAVMAALTALAAVPQEDHAPHPTEIEIPDFVPVPVELEAPDDARTERDWVIHFRAHPELYTKANDPQFLLRELQRLGIVEVVLDDSALPLLSDLSPENAYLALTISLRTAQDAPAIREIFEFVEFDCDLDIKMKPAETLPAKVLLVDEQKSAQSAPCQTVPSPASDGESVAAPKSIPVPPPATIRADLERVDRLINIVSELVICEATLTESLSETATRPDSNVTSALDDLRQLTRDIQESVMAIRAQPVKTVFQRLPRLVREIVALTGKPVKLLTQGEETEVDRAVIEGLTDPLIHMLRNAIDHGIEPPENRLRANKPVPGVVRVSAGHRGGRIVIEVADDGEGINREKVRAIATERGLISATDTLSEEQLDNLIFEPGFSTADSVSDLSGRGVGMDVVKRGVQALGGRISVASRTGHGTTMTLSLPLTLAVLDGMLISVCGQNLVVPLSALLETVQINANTVRSLGHSASMLAIHGRYVPIIDLGTVLGYRTQAAALTEGVALLVENDLGESAALLTDDIMGQRQVVIKSLEENYRPVEGVSAATILGNGKVALILDVNAIIATQKRKYALADKELVA
jgi:two-component system chemotaxis sensor kinase CheA